MPMQTRTINTETDLFMANVPGMDCRDENDSCDNGKHRCSHVVTDCPSPHLVQVENASTFDGNYQFCHGKMVETVRRSKCSRKNYGRLYLSYLPGE